MAENVLNRDFNSPTKSNEIWLTDIADVWSGQGWMYLAVILDLFTRKGVGRSCDTSMPSQLVCDTMQNATDRERPEGAVLCHSDRGSQFVSGQYQSSLKENGFTYSKSRRGDCWNNAPMESFFGILKKELVHYEQYESRVAARRSLFKYFEAFYNTIRKHSSLGDKSPVQFQQVF